MKAALWILAIGFLGVALLGVRLADDPELQAQYNLSGSLNEVRNRELAVVFSDDMLPLGGRRDPAPLLRIAPSIPGQFSWRGTRTLVFRPADRWAFSTRYQIEVPAGIVSLDHKKTMRKALHWEIVTPAPRPVGIRSGSDKYFTSIGADEIWANPLWVKDDLVLNFDQPVSIAQLKGFLQVGPEKEKSAIACRLSRESDVQVRLHFPGELARETDYQLTVRKGFSGTEGECGRPDDFRFRFCTTPRFRVALKRPDLPFTPDVADLWIPFSNPLRDLPASALALTASGPRGERKLRFALQTVDPGDRTVRLRLANPERLEAGETFRLEIGAGALNIWGEPLEKSFVMTVPVCSSYQPEIEAFLEGNKLTVHAKSIEKAAWRLYKLRDSFLPQTADPMWGVLHRPEFTAAWLEKEAAREWSPENDGIGQKEFDLQAELGSRLGFFAVRVERARPFNVCRSAYLHRFPLRRQEALQVVHLREMDFLLRSAPGRQLVWLYDNRRGLPRAGLPLQLERSGRVLELGKTDDFGRLAIDQPLQSGDLLQAIDGARSDRAFYRMSPADVPAEPVLTRIHLFSERGFYKPGETVHLAGIVKEYSRGRLATPEERKALMVVRGPDWREAARAEVTLDERGGLSWDYPSKADGPKGAYTFQLQFGAQTQSLRAVIDYYQPNTFEVTISGMPERFLRRDQFRAEVAGAYLAGNPMAGDALDTGVELEPGAPAAVSSLPEAREFQFGLDSGLVRRDAPYRTALKLDDSGRHSSRLGLDRFQATNCASTLRFTAIAKSSEGKEVTATQEALFLPGERICGLQLPYYNSSKLPLKAKLLLLDAAGKSVEGEVSATLFRVEFRDYQRTLKPVGAGRDVFVKGETALEWPLPGPGDYLLKIDAKDAGGAVTSTSACFWAWSSDQAPENDQLSVQAEKPAYRTGETATVYIRSPRPARALVTVESHTIHDSRVIDLAQTTPFSFEVRKEHFPAVKVAVSALLADNQSEEAETTVSVEDEGQKLKVAIEAPAEVKPSAPTRAVIQVTGQDGKGRRSKLFVWAVDEGNLSLSAYHTPDPYRHFWREGEYLARSPIRSLYSRDCTSWTFVNPDLDIPLGPAGLFGRVMLEDGAPHRGARVTLLGEKKETVATAAVSAAGYYHFASPPPGRYFVRAEAQGFQPGSSEVFLPSSSILDRADFVLLPTGMPEAEGAGIDGFDGDSVLNGVEGAAQGGVMGGVMAEGVPPPAAAPMAKSMSRAMKKEADGAEAVAGIALRQNFQEVLFFRRVETDENGRAEVDFETSDQLSAYRLMAVAYDEDSFGTADQRLTVSKDLLVSENMPEFARFDDAFRAGFMVSNRLADPLAVRALVQVEGIEVRGPAEQRFSLGGRRNQAALFDFRADRTGQAQLKFYALSERDQDGLLQKLAVTDNLVTETLLDFDSGGDLAKTIQPQAEAEKQSLRIKAAPSILRPAVKIAEKLVFYPYECLEQRTSKALPFLALDQALVERLGLKLDQQQVRASVQAYLDVIPEFQNGAGGLGYYRNSPWPSEYLTAYVLWAMELARDRDYRVNGAVMERAAAFLAAQKLSPEPDAFFQYVLSLQKKADEKKLRQLFGERAKLSLTARSFLLRALHRQGLDSAMEKELVSGFNNDLQVEADFAYFDASASVYWRDLPFLSSRYLTALVTSALLETGADFSLAPRVINWLLETGPEQWQTTQTNFWILEAMGRYARRFESQLATRAEAEILGETVARNFSGPGDYLETAKNLDGRKEPLSVRVRGDGRLYLTSELSYQLRTPGAKSRGIAVERNLYGSDGQLATRFRRGQTYQVEILIDADKEVPYGVIDDPLAAGFEVLRQDVSTTRELKEFNRAKAASYGSGWLRQENSPDRVVFYSYSLRGKIRVVYFVKALYSGTFTWLPTVVQGMYHPQYFGRGATMKVEVKE